MTTPCFVANWKMNKTIAETKDYFSTLQEKLPHLLRETCDLIIAPPHTALFCAAQAIKTLHLPIFLSAQNFHFEKEGAYTGEVSAKMLCEIGCQYVIIGHSERRTHFGETDQGVAKKRVAALQAGLIPIVCIGETAREREEGKTLVVLKRQIEEGFSGVFNQPDQTIVAYEPIWAIGTGKTPLPFEVNQIHQAIADHFSGLGKHVPRILYGGSVNERNMTDFIKEKYVDGVLAGGSSLSAETLVQMIASIVTS
ncbi:MAG: triose-phosphate isomerase [Nitrospirota bacterium]